MTEMADNVASEIQRLNADVTQSVEDFNNNSEEALSAPLSIIIFGATGNLAREKLYPALQQLMRNVASKPRGASAVVGKPRGKTRGLRVYC